jgi:hypothetical protein
MIECLWCDRPARVRVEFLDVEDQRVTEYVCALHYAATCDVVKMSGLTVAAVSDAADEAPACDVLQLALFERGEVLAATV